MQENKSEHKIERRELLKLAALGAVPYVLMGCQSNVANSGASTAAPTATPTKPPTPTAKAAPDEGDWSALAKSMQGTLVRPSSAQYGTAVQLFDPRYDSVRPQAIAYCASPTDAQNCLAFVRRFNLAFAVRSGGHSYAGYSTSTGMIIDVSRMNTISINAAAGTATIGAGAKLIDVYNALAQQGLVLPAGSCPTVGVAGLTLGGGVGVIGRKFGLTCDNLQAAQVVLADGRVQACSSTQEPDLFWGLRGGGGGNFGVATSFTFKVHRVDALTLFTFGWPWSQAAAVVNGWQNWAPQAPDEVWSNCLLLATGDKSAGPIVHINGVYVGSPAQLDPLLQQLMSKIGAEPGSRYVSGASILETMLYEAGCYGKSVAECHLPSQNPAGQMRRDTSAVKSSYFGKALSSSGINNLVNAIARRQAASNLGEGGIGMDSYGGAINRVAPDATAFAHRNALFSAQFSASWNASDPQAVVTANQSWLNETWQSMQPFGMGASYQNYVDPGLKDWQHAYYGTNFERLQKIKAAYDPHNTFKFAQSISLP